MQAAPTRYVSVSELYSTDEVELLLDEIRGLEPTSCRGEDVQDFEIAGSGCGGGAGAGGRSPAGTELTDRSWDSHAHYHRAPPPPPRPLAPVYCRLRHLRTLPGAATLLLLLCCSSVCGCVWGAVGLRLGSLPLASRVQLLLLGALSSLMLHGALLAMHVSGLTALLPLDWAALAAATGAWSGVALAAGGTLTLHAVLAAPAYRFAPPAVACPLLAAGALALAGVAAAAALMAVSARWPSALRRRAGRADSARGAYRAVPSAPPPASAAPRPSTSRDDPL